MSFEQYFPSFPNIFDNFSTLDYTIKLLLPVVVTTPKIFRPKIFCMDLISSVPYVKMWSKYLAIWTSQSVNKSRILPLSQSVSK